MAAEGLGAGDSILFVQAVNINKIKSKWQKQFFFKAVLFY